MKAKNSLLFCTVSGLIGTGVGYKLGLFHGQRQELKTFSWIDGKDNLPPGSDWTQYSARSYNNTVIAERVTNGYISQYALSLLEKSCTLDPDNKISRANRLFALLNLADQKLNTGDMRRADHLIKEAHSSAQSLQTSEQDGASAVVLY